MIIRALPSCGKTYLVKSQSTFVDTDGLLLAVTGDKSYGAHHMIGDGSQKSAIFDALVKLTIKQRHLVTNCDLSSLGLQPDIVVGYSPDDYIKHIKLCGRVDLLRNNSEKVLREWAASLDEKAIRLKPGTFLLDALPTILLLGEKPAHNRPL